MRNTPVEHKQTGWVGGNAKHKQTIDRRRPRTELPQEPRSLTSVYCMLCLSTFRNVSSRACLWHAAFFARGGCIPPRLSSLNCSCKSKLGLAPAVVANVQSASGACIRLYCFQILGSSCVYIVYVYKSQGGTAGPMLGTCACTYVMPSMGTLGAPTLRHK